MKAIINTPICSLYKTISRESSLEDEALYGMIVDILEEPAPGWYRVRTHYRYEGYVMAEDLLLGEETVSSWQTLPKKVVFHKNFCDILSEPKVQGWHLITLPRGAAVAPVGQAENGWQKVLLADGRCGYVPASFLMEYPAGPVSEDEDTLRRALVDTVMTYKGTHYRWGGKTPQGIDCSGLCSTTYMLCGILIYRDAKIVEGFPIHEIPREQMKPGDLLFFPGHVAMYIGDNRYCHSTSKLGSEGFSINSLDPEAPDFRADLLEKLVCVGSYF